MNRTPFISKLETTEHFYFGLTVNVKNTNVKKLDLTFHSSYIVKIFILSTKQTKIQIDIEQI